MTHSDSPTASLSRNPVLLCVHQALMMSLFPMAILTLYLRDHLALSVAEIMAVQALFGASLAFFEFPSGYLADRIGYRISLILASGLAAGGWLLYSLATGFASVAIAEVVLGFSLSLVSGTNSALLYESLDHEGRAEEFTRWFGRARFFGQMSEGSAALVAGLIFAFSVRLPFLLMAGVWVLNIGIAAALVEPPRERKQIAKPVAHVRSLVRFVAREAPRLRALFGVGIILGLATFVPVWLVALYAKDAGVPVAWLGPIWAFANYAVAIASLSSERVGLNFGLHSTLLLCCGFIGMGYLGMGFVETFWGFVFYFAFCLSRGLAGPILAQAEQDEIPSGDRASLVSLRSLGFRLAFVGVGPLVGLAIDAQGQHRVLLGLGVFFVLAGLSSVLWLRNVAPSPAQRVKE